MPGPDPKTEEAVTPGAGRALSDDPALFRLLIENAEDLICLHDLDARTVYANPSACHLLGTGPASWFDAVHPDDVERGRGWWRQLLAGGREPIEWRVRDWDGAWRWLEARGSVVPYQEKPHVLAVCREITDRKRAEELARLREEQLRLVNDAIPVMAWTVQTDGVVDFLNRQWIDFSGLSLEQYAADPTSAIHPDDLARVMDRWREQIQSGKAYDDEMRLRRSDGEYRWFLVRTAPVRDEQGRVVKWCGVSTDIEDRKRAEVALRESERRLNESQRIAHLGHWEQDLETGCITASDEMYRIFGLAPRQGLRTLTDWNEQVHPEDRPIRAAAIEQALREGSRYQTEYRVVRPSGEVRIVRGQGEVERDDSGQPRRLFGILQDLTERRRLEDQFRQAQKMEAIGQLAGGIAHDFNNLLTIISGYSELLLPRLTAEDPRREMVSQIREAGERATGLTRQLLAFSRQTVLAPKVLDLNELVRENEKMLCRLIGEDVELVTHLEPGLASVKADPGQISQVVMNLAVNARDAMPTGGELSIETSTVTVSERGSAAPEASPGRFVVLTVSDTGTGMTPEVRAHIYEPYFTTKAPGKGTGLGLATVYGIVQQSGGFISVASEPGQGASFKIHFPAMEERAPVTKPYSGAETLARGTETILLVEDEDLVRSMVQFVLQQAGYTVLTASRGGEALRVAAEQTEPISLLITDVVMPEMSGRELVEQLARVRPEIKVLYLSGYTDDAVVRHGVLEAETAFLQKPFTMVSLTNKVREVLDTIALS